MTPTTKPLHRRSPAQDQDPDQDRSPASTRSGVGETSPAGSHYRPDPRALRMASAMESVLGYPFTQGNKVDVLRNGDEIFPAMLEAIAAARRRIEFLTFVYWTGDIAQVFADALSAKAREGVEVLVVLDGFGARPMNPKCLDQMEQAGVEVRWFRPLPRLRVWQSDNRTHRKLLILDGRVGFTGGVGVAAEWEGSAQDEDHWRDSHFRFTGPVVAGLRAAFYEDWIESGGDLAPMFSVAPTPARARPGVDATGGVLAQVAPAGAAVGQNAVARLHEGLVRLARERLRIVTPYFSPDEDMARLLEETCRRGVQVEIMIPGPVIDKRLSELASAEHWSGLLKAGATIWRYQPTMLHAKLITVDRRLACVGSANFNQRSRLKDHEVAVNLLDAPLCAELDAHFDEDVEKCERLSLNGWRKRGIFRRALEKVSRPFQPEV